MTPQYFINRFSERDNVFPKAKIGQCRLLPIKIAAMSEQEPIVNIVDKVIRAKLHGMDTTQLEMKIDLLTYRLYDLTYDEVKVIDPDFGMSEGEYNSIKLEE